MKISLIWSVEKFYLEWVQEAELTIKFFFVYDISLSEAQASEDIVKVIASQQSHCPISLFGTPHTDLEYSMFSSRFSCKK